MRPRVGPELRSRAGEACEYCRLPERVSKLRFVPDHIVSRQHGGTDDVGNLALSCPFCNRHKGPNVAGVDPVGGAVVRLFHPRLDRWEEHFRAEGALVVGLTDVGRATVRALAINHREQLVVREGLCALGEWPPARSG